MCKNFSSKPNDLPTSKDFNIFPEPSITAIYVMGYFQDVIFFIGEFQPKFVHLKIFYLFIITSGVEL